VNYRQKTPSPAAVARELGGRRIAVLGHPLQSTTMSEAKRKHLQAILVWLKGGPLPAAVEDVPDVCPVVLRDAASGVIVVSLINASTALASGFRLTLPAPHGRSRIRYCDDDGKMVTLPARCLSRERGRMVITVPPAAGIAPYDVRLFRIEPRR